MVIKYITIIIFIIFCLLFLMPLLVFPGFLRGEKFKVTNKTKKISKKLRGKNKEKTLRNVFNYVKKMYSTERYNLFIKLGSHFHRDINKLVDKKQFLPCHMQSFVLVSLLMSTGQFKKEDLKKKIIMRPSIMIHEYYLIKIKDKKFKVDPFLNILQKIK